VGAACSDGNPLTAAPLGGVERALGKVRFARSIHPGARVLGGPAVRAAYGGNRKPARVATHRDPAEAPAAQRPDNQPPLRWLARSQCRRPDRPRDQPLAQRAGNADGFCDDTTPLLPPSPPANVQSKIWPLDSGGATCVTEVCKALSRLSSATTWSNGRPSLGTTSDPPRGSGAATPPSAAISRARPDFNAA
jgi:hypothetical protein